MFRLRATLPSPLALGAGAVAGAGAAARPVARSVARTHALVAGPVARSLALALPFALPLLLTTRLVGVADAVAVPVDEGGARRVLSRRLGENGDRERRYRRGQCECHQSFHGHLLGSPFGPLPSVGSSLSKARATQTKAHRWTPALSRWAENGLEGKNACRRNDFGAPEPDETVERSPLLVDIKNLFARFWL